MSCQFSVIVPTYDRVAQLRTCLAGLAQLDYPREQFEVIVVDDGSAVPLADVIQPSVDGMAVTIVRIPNAGPGAARNVGAARARGRFLAFTDDDCRPAPSWLRMLDASCARTPDRLIGGRTVNALRQNSWSATSQVIVDMAYGFYNAEPEVPRFFASNNMVMPADRYVAIGGFRSGAFRIASEDREICDRWRHAGYGLAYAPDAVVEHAHDLGLRSFCRQHFRYGRGALRYHQLRAQRRSGRFWQDVPFYLQLPRLLRHAVRHLDGRQTAAVLPRLVLWQVCNTAGYLYERGRARESEALVAEWPTPPSSARPSP